MFLFISHNSFSRSLEEIKRSGKIYVGFTVDDYKNINYVLAHEFAKYLNVELIEVKINWEDIFKTKGKIPKDLETNPQVQYTPDIFSKVDLISSTFTILEWRKKLFQFAETLYSTELLIINKNSEVSENFEGLSGKKIAFLQNTSFETHLNEINKKIGGGIFLKPKPNVNEAKNDLINGKVYGIVMDADEALSFQSKNNRFKIAFPISKITKSAWAVEKNNILQTEVESFFETISNNEVLDRIFKDFYQESYSRFVETIRKSSRLTIYHRDLTEILKSKKLVVAFRNRDFVYHPTGNKQFMHALAEEFADYLGVQLEYVISPNETKYWTNQKGDIIQDSSYIPDWFNYFDIACDVFLPLESRKNKVNFISIYPSEYTIIAKKETVINKIDDLKKLKGVTEKNSEYENILIKNGISNYYYTKTDDLIKEVLNGNADYAMIYNSFFELSDYPELETKLPMGSLNVSWALRKDQKLLQDKIQTFIENSKQSGLINILMKALNTGNNNSSEDFITSYYSSLQTGELPYVSYGAEDGLPQEDVFSIFQDAKGYMWFGTNSGAVRYNGREMLGYSSKNGLNDNTVLDIKQDKDKNIFFATSKGISILKKDKNVTNFFTEIAFKSIYIDKNNTKWFMGDEGVYTIDSNNNKYSFNQKYQNLPQIVNDFCEDKTGVHKFFATNKGIYYYSEKDNLIYRLTNETCFSIIIDSNDSIWFSTKEGLFISDITNLKKRDNSKIKKLNTKLKLSDNIIKKIHFNEYGTIWLVTDAEILQVISTDRKAFVYQSDAGLKNNTIHSFLEDKEDNLWIGFSGGLQKLTKRNGIRNFYPGHINSNTYSIFQDIDERIWFATNNGLFYYKNKLEQFTTQLSNSDKKIIATLLTNGNIIVADNHSFLEIDVNTLQIVRKNNFTHSLLGIENIFITKKGEIFILTGINGIVYYFNNFYAQPKSFENKLSSNIFQLIEYKGEIIGGNKEGIVKFSDQKFEMKYKLDCAVWTVCNNDNKLWVGTDCGLYIIDNEIVKKITVDKNLMNLVIKSIYPAKNKNYLWIGTNNGFYYFNKFHSESEFSISSKDGLPGDEITVNGLFIDNNDLLWVGTYHGVSNFNIRAKTKKNFAPFCYIENLFVNGINIDPKNTAIFKHNENNFVFEISGLTFTDEKSIEYEFYLRGLENDYSSYNKGTEYKAYYSNLPAGKYEFIYKAKGKNNIWGYAQKFQFTVNKAWYETWGIRFASALLIILIIWALYKLRIRTIEQQKKLLANQVKERTKELEKVNEKVNAQMKVATEQRDLISLQKQEITDSIYYAEKIQHSILPSRTKIGKFFPENFVLFKPRDIVSGDFYWSTTKNNKFVITAADCTGHGVPGAFMSMLGVAYLNEIVNKAKTLQSNEILNSMREEIISALNQKNIEGENKDGMDMSICVFDFENKNLQFSGAISSLYLVRNGEMIIYKGDKMPVAIHSNLESFTKHNIKIKKDDCFYMFSDGYADQFGGPQGKKFLSKRLRELILQISVKPMQEQKEILTETIENWRIEAHAEQVDDIIVIGLKV